MNIYTHDASMYPNSFLCARYIENDGCFFSRRYRASKNCASIASCSIRVNLRLHSSGISEVALDHKFENAEQIAEALCLSKSVKRFQNTLKFKTISHMCIKNMIKFFYYKLHYSLEYQFGLVNGF